MARSNQSERLGGVEGAVGGLQHAQTILIGTVGVLAAITIGGFIYLAQQLDSTRSALQAQLIDLNKSVADIRVVLAEVRARVDLLPGMKERLEKRADVAPASNSVSPNKHTELPVAAIEAPISPEVIQTTSAKYTDLGSFSAADLYNALKKIEVVKQPLDGKLLVRFQDQDTWGAAYKKIPADLTKGILVFKSLTGGVDVVSSAKLTKQIVEASASSIAGKQGHVKVLSDDPGLIQTLTKP